MSVSFKDSILSFPFKDPGGSYRADSRNRQTGGRELVPGSEQQLVILSSAEREFYRIESKFLTVNVKLSGSGNSFCFYLRSDSGCPEYVS